MIPKKFRGVPWCVFVLKVGDLGQFSYDKKVKVGDVGKMVMNVNLFENETSSPIWAEFKVTKVISKHFIEGVVVNICPTQRAPDLG